MHLLDITPARFGRNTAMMTPRPMFPMAMTSVFWGCRSQFNTKDLIVFVPSQCHADGFPLIEAALEQSFANTVLRTVLPSALFPQFNP